MKLHNHQCYSRMVIPTW